MRVIFTISCCFANDHPISRSAAELDELFERKIAPRRFHKTETATQRIVNLEKDDVAILRE